jgi:hypothetical protein
MKNKLMKYGIAFVLATLGVAMVCFVTWGLLKLHPLSLMIFPVGIWTWVIAQAIEINEVEDDRNK